MPIRTAHVFVSSSGEPLIWPPVIVANKNDEIEINNATDKDIVIIYPSGVFDDGGGGLEAKKTAHVEATKTKAPKKKVFNNNSVLGNHAFQVFCFATRSFAKGNSDPEIIIE